MAIDGTYEIETEPTRSCGEAGLEHLTAPLTGIRFDSTAGMREFAEWLMTKVPGEVAAPDRIHVNSTFNGRIQGRYQSGTRTLEIAPHKRLRTLVHELAHHVNSVVYGERGHGRSFKMVFRALLTETYKRLEMETPEAPTKSRERLSLPSVGTEVIVSEPQGSRVWLGTVLKAKVKYCHVQDQETKKVWNVPAQIMTW